MEGEKKEGKFWNVKWKAFSMQIHDKWSNIVAGGLRENSGKSDDT